MEIQINLEVIQAIALFQAKQNIRYYLNGILLETGSDGARLVATDGHTMAIANVSNDVFPAASIIIPRDMVDQLKGKSICHPIFSFDAGNCSDRHSEDSVKTNYDIMINWQGNILVSKEIDGMFPDYSRIIPRQPASGEVAQYNPEYLTRIVKANQLLNGKNAKYPGICHNGGNVGYVVLGDFIALIMPIEAKPSFEIPAWVTIELNLAVALAA